MHSYVCMFFIAKKLCKTEIKAIFLNNYLWDFLLLDFINEDCGMKESKWMQDDL